MSDSRTSAAKDLPLYDATNMYDDRIGPEGMPSGELSRMERMIGEAKRAVLEMQPGFFTIPAREAELKEVERLAKDVAKKFRMVVVIGIGGSDLGARAMLHALGGRAPGMDVAFIGANTDPEELAMMLRDIKIEECVLNVISKSGDTLETMSTFLLLRELLIKKVGPKKHAEHVVCTTDADGGTLREIAKREGYRTLPVPQGIGGRYSALTSVGLFPAACAGLSVRELVAGAGAMLREFQSAEGVDNGPALFAALHADAYHRRGKNITVLMPYGDALHDLGFWFRQLWAESLGKKRDRRGVNVFRGFTPVAALGATDQHSQLQLYMEGPLDKIVTFVEIQKYRDEYTVPKAYPDLPAVAWMGGRKFSDLHHAERQATAEALADAGRPSGTISLPRVSAKSVGAFMMFFMCATAVAAELLDVDAYDQPGVEDGKRLIKELLGVKPDANHAATP